MARQKTLSIVAVAVINAFLMQGSDAQDAQSGWQIFQRRVPLLKESYKGNYYQHDAIKRDYFIFRKKVVIDDLLQTNGGDVIIAADELIINAPIDTRVHFGIGPNYWAESRDSKQDWFSLMDVFYESPQQMKSFDWLYMWREAYDPKTKMFRFSVAERPVVIPRPNSVPEDEFNEMTEAQMLGQFGGQTMVREVAQLPSAPVSDESSKEYGHSYATIRPTDGSDPPDNEIYWENVKSGHIIVYTKSILLCGSCVNALDNVVAAGSTLDIPVPQPDGLPPKTLTIKQAWTDPDPGDLDQAVFFQVSGLKGGRGGAGSVNYCYPYEEGNRCPNVRPKQGGLSGNPGHAGDAGSIEFHFVNQAVTDSDRQLLLKASKANGGRPAQASKQRTPNYSELSKGNRNIFKNEQPIGNLAALNGVDGTILIDEINSDAALSSIGQHLLAADNRNYAIDLMLRDPALNPNSFTTSPSEVLQPFLAQELSRLQADFLGEILPSLTTGASNVLSFSSFFSSLTCQPDKYILLAQLSRDYLKAICEFNRFNAQNDVQSFFLRSGGLFNSVPKDVNSVLQYNNILVQLNRIQQSLAAARSDIGQVHRLLFEEVSQQQATSLQQALEALQQKRAALEKALADAVAKMPSFSDDLKSLQEGGQKIAGAIAKIYSANVIGYMSASEDLVTGFEEIGKVLTRVGSVPEMDDIHGLNAAIEDAKAALTEFHSSVIKIRRDIEANKFQNLRDLLDERQILEQERAAIRFKFGDFLRATIQEFLRDSDETELKSNIQKVLAIHDETEVPPTLSISSLGDLCSGKSLPVAFDQLTGQAGCIKFDRGKTFFVILSKVAPLSNFPLLTVEPGSGSLPRSFEEAVRAEDLMKVEFPDTHP